MRFTDITFSILAIGSLANASAIRPAKGIGLVARKAEPMDYERWDAALAEDAIQRESDERQARFDREKEEAEAKLKGKDDSDDDDKDQAVDRKRDVKAIGLVAREAEPMDNERWNAFLNDDLVEKMAEERQARFDREKEEAEAKAKSQRTGDSSDDGDKDQADDRKRDVKTIGLVAREAGLIMSNEMEEALNEDQMEARAREYREKFQREKEEAEAKLKGTDKNAKPDEKKADDRKRSAAAFIDEWAINAPPEEIEARFKLRLDKVAEKKKEAEARVKAAKEKASSSGEKKVDDKRKRDAEAYIPEWAMDTSREELEARFKLMREKTAENKKIAEAKLKAEKDKASSSGEKKVDDKKKRDAEAGFAAARFQDELERQGYPMLALMVGQDRLDQEKKQAEAKLKQGVEKAKGGPSGEKKQKDDRKKRDADWLKNWGDKVRDMQEATRKFHEDRGKFASTRNDEKQVEWRRKMRWPSESQAKEKKVDDKKKRNAEAEPGLEAWESTAKAMEDAEQFKDSPSPKLRKMSKAGRFAKKLFGSNSGKEPKSMLKVKGGDDKK